MEQGEKRMHFYWLDLFRFLAAFLVVISHAKSIFIADFENLAADYQVSWIRGILSLSSQGHMAVLVFFVLSGFLVGGKAIEKIKNNSFDYWSYSVDRLVRIALPLIGSLLFIYVGNTLIGTSYSSLDYLGNLFSLQGVLVPWVSGPLWSLSYEVWCYILMLGIGLLSGSKKSQLIGLYILFLFFIVYTHLEVVYLFVWLLGALFYFVKIRRTRYSMFFAFVLLCISDVCIKVYYQQNIHLRFLFELIFSLSFGFLLVQFLQIIPSRGWSKCINRFGVKMARFSYTLYLSHYAVLQLLHYYGLPQSNKLDALSIGVWFGTSFICVGAAWMLYFLFEKHTYTVKQYIKCLYREKINDPKELDR